MYWAGMFWVMVLENWHVESFGRTPSWSVGVFFWLSRAYHRRPIIIITTTLPLIIRIGYNNT